MTGPSQRPKLVISFDDEESVEAPAATRAPLPAAASPQDLPSVSLRPHDGTSVAAAPVRGDWAPPSVGSAPSRDWGPPAPPVPPIPGAMPSAVPLAGEHALASWWQRAGAMTIDAFVVWIMSLPLVAIFFVAAGNSIGGLIAAYLALSVVPAIIGFIYYPYMLSRSGARNGQTLGKQALGIRVVSISPTGPEVRGGQAVLREFVMRQLVLSWLSALLLWIPLLLDALWPLWQSERRSLHDLAASTIVVRADR